MMKVIDVAAALIFHKGSLLITQRRAHDHLGGLWEFPGGKVETGESFEQCLEREIREELGIQIEVGQLVEALTHSYPEKAVHLKFFRCTWLSGELSAIGCAAYKWVKPSELVQHEFPAADARLLETLKQTQGLW